MAKLNGVKTLDMVNGGITKIAYEGAEYLLTTEKAVEGDLITFLPSARRDVTQGEFYKVTGVCHFNDTIRMIDDVEDDHYWFRENPKFKTFRKVSTDSPTLEQRVETLESDVAALKGEKVSEEPKRLTIWDKAKIVGNISLHSGGIGDIVTIIEDAKDEQPYRCERISDGKDVGWFYEEDLVAHVDETIEFEGATYRKVEREAREGDVVIFKGVECQSSYTEDGVPYKVIAENTYVLEDGDGYSISGWDYHSVNVYEPIEQSKYVPQEGDIVVITGNRCDSRNAVGDIGKITKVKSYGINVEVPSKPNSPKVNGNLHLFDEVRKATPAEVEKYEQALMEIEKAHKDAEIAEKWAKIGRKPNEFKKGDIVRVVGNGRKGRYSPHIAKIGEVLIVERMGSQFPDRLGTTKGFILPEYAELVAPVESLFNA